MAWELEQGKGNQGKYLEEEITGITNGKAPRPSHSLPSDMDNLNHTTTGSAHMRREGVDQTSMHILGQT